jgi:uncharacterized protein YabE (DUF348 family)
MLRSRWILWFVGFLVVLAVGLIGMVIFQVILSINLSGKNTLSQLSITQTAGEAGQVKTLLIQDGGVSRTITTQADTLADALKENGIVLQTTDRVTPVAESTIEGLVSVTIVHGRNVKVQTAQGEVVIATSAQSIGDALADAGLTPQGLDYSLPPLESTLPADGLVRLVRVRLDMPLTMKLTSFETSYRAVDDIGMGKRKEIQAGQQGVIAQGRLLRYEDGQAISDEKIAEFTLSTPKERVVGYGTKVEKQILEIPGGKLEYWQAITMYATSYSPCRLGIPNHCNNTTASGAKLVKGIAAFVRADYNQYLNTQVYVPGYGIATIADIGGGVPGKRWIDLGYSDDDFQTWARDVTVYFLWPPPAASPGG